MSAGNIADDSNGADAAVAETATKRSYPKTHANYWKSRLEHRTYTRDGKTFEVAEWSVRIYFKGIRKSFDLETANKEEAAAKARDIYLSILAKGWSATINELAPQLVPLAEMGSDSTTVGSFLAEVERTANLKSKTFRYYSQCLRQFAAYVHGVKSDASRFDYLKSGLAAWGVMYIDGHFLPYYGLYPISKGWHGVRQRPMKGSYNFLTVDEGFAPWLFLIRSSSEDLLQKIPELIEKAKRIGEQAGVNQERLDRLIVVFDREGYSAELYRYLDGKDQGAGKRRALFISWAKYSDKWVNDLAEEQFKEVAQVTYEIRKAEAIPYLETTRAMSKYGKIRAVVIQNGRDKKRAAIYTNGGVEEISGERIVQLICRRWGEENAIKELLHKHQINYTPGYVLEELQEQPRVDNPQVKELKKQRARLVSELNRLKIELADHLLEPPARKRRIPRRSQKEVMDDITVVEGKILLADEQLDKLPSEVRFDQAHAGEKLLKLNHEKKRFLDCIKVFVCNLEAQMCSLLLKYYDWEKEVVPALAMIVERTGYVKLERGRLEVTLRRFTDREIDYAARHLCEDLNGMCPVTLDKFHLPIRYHVQ